MDGNLWANVIFSDEARIELYSRQRQYVCRPVGQRFYNIYTMKTWNMEVRLYWYGELWRVMVKGLMQVPPLMNSEEYQKILDNSLISFINNDSIFMQDEAPCYRSKSTLKYLDRRHICAISDSPVQSPDLNIIENLWSVLKSRVQKRLPKTSNELWVITNEESNAISKKASRSD